MTSKNSKFELEIILNIKRIRVERKKSQSSIACLLDVTDGYIGQIESPKWPAMYTFDQLNKIALDFDCNPRDFLPDKGIIEEVVETKKDNLQSGTEI